MLDNKLRWDVGQKYGTQLRMQKWPARSIWFLRHHLHTMQTLIKTLGKSWGIKKISFQDYQDSFCITVLEDYEMEGALLDHHIFTKNKRQLHL